MLDYGEPTGASMPYFVARSDSSSVSTLITVICGRGTNDSTANCHTKNSLTENL